MKNFPHVVINIGYPFVIEERLTIQLFLIECKEDSGTLLMNSEGSILILIFFNT